MKKCKKCKKGIVLTHLEQHGESFEKVSRCLYCQNEVRV